MTNQEIKTAYEQLRRRVLAVVSVHRRAALEEGAGRCFWMLAAPLLAVVLIEWLVDLPLALRAPILPAFFIAAIWLGWKHIVRPLLVRYSVSRAAMLVEAARPDLKSRVVSALQLYPELEKEQTHFDRAMLRGLVQYAQESTADQNFTEVVDKSGARRALRNAALAVIAWTAVLVANPSIAGDAFGRFYASLGELQDVARIAGGAGIVIEDTGQPAFLRGSDITLKINQKGFHNEAMSIFIRADGEANWQESILAVDERGNSTYRIPKAEETFECYAAAGRIRSDRKTIIVTERPRIVKLSVEYNLPAYVRRAPVVQPRSDGNLTALYGSSILLRVEANKPLKSAIITTSFGEKPHKISTGGQFAQGAIRVENENWLTDESAQEIAETYSLELVDEYGFTNEDADQPRQLLIQKDQPPQLAFVGIPNKSSADEPKIMEKNVDQLSLSIQGRDDYGIAKVVLHYRVEDLESNAVKREEQMKSFTFGLPRTQISRLLLARVSTLDLQVGDRLVFWAEAEDAYDLGPKEKCPHTYKTPVFRIAVVSEEQMFAEVRYRDEWSAYWYDDLKVATLARRSPPPRTAPEGEPAAKVALKLLDAVPVNEGFSGENAQAIENYFKSLAGVE